MSRQYQKLPRTMKRVSFDESAGIDYEAPRSSIELGRNSMSPFHAAPHNKEADSDDEIDTLLAEDPLYEEKEGNGLRGSGGSRISKKKKRVLIAGISLLLLALVATLTGLGVGSRTKSSAPANVLTGDDKEASDKMALEEIQGMTEVPTLVGSVPLSDMPHPINNHVSDAALGQDSPVQDDQIISVPSTKVDYDNEAADKAAYEAEAAKDDGMEDNNTVSNDPPELSSEAIAQAQGVNAELGKASAAVTESASKIVQHKDPLESLRTAANDLLSWLQAQWRDVMNNKPSSEQEIY